MWTLAPSGLEWCYPTLRRWTPLFNLLSLVYVLYVILKVVQPALLFSPVFKISLFILFNFTALSNLCWWLALLLIFLCYLPICRILPSTFISGVPIFITKPAMSWLLVIHNFLFYHLPFTFLKHTSSVILAPNSTSTRILAKLSPSFFSVF